MALCLVIVAGSVLFGVFGPGIAQRSTLGGAVSIGDLVATAVMQRDQLLWHALESDQQIGAAPPDLRVTPAPGTSTNEENRRAAGAALARAIGHEVTIPDLSSAGYELAVWTSASLGGGRDDAIALGYLNEATESFVALYLLADDGRFVVFDGFGRAVPLLPDRLFAEETPLANGRAAEVMVWSTGPVLLIAVVDSHEEAHALRPLIGAP